MKLRARTSPDLSTSSLPHQKAAALGYDHFVLSERNVIDEFKSLPDEEIIAKLAATANPFAVLLENWLGDLNVSTCIRNANAFNAKELFYIGDKRIDRRGACGSYHYTKVQWLSTIEQVVELKKKYTFIAIDNITGSVPMETYKWKENSLLVFGCEGTGLTKEMQALCEETVHITQCGSIRSLNCGTASGIIMHDFMSKYKANK